MQYVTCSSSTLVVVFKKNPPILFFQPMSVKFCTVCSAIATQQCCPNINYCSSTCQKKHRVEHKRTCLRKKVHLFERSLIKGEYNVYKDLISENPYLAKNSYTPCARKSKTEPTCEKLEGLVTRVFNNNLYTAHEDPLFLITSTTQNLYQIQKQNPTHRFTAQMIVPGDFPLPKAHERLGLNVLSQVSQAYDVAVYGGMVETLADQDNIYLLAQLPDDTKVSPPLDLAFLTDHLPDCVQLLWFKHFGYKNDWLLKSVWKPRFFDEKGNFLPLSISTFRVSKKSIADSTRPSYPLLTVLQCIRSILHKNSNLRNIALNVLLTVKEGEDWQKVSKKALEGLQEDYNVNIIIEWPLLVYVEEQKEKVGVRKFVPST